MDNRTEGPGGVPPAVRSEKLGDRPKEFQEEFQKFLKQIMEGQLPPDESIPAFLGTLEIVLRRVYDEQTAISSRIETQPELKEQLEPTLERVNRQVADLEAARLALKSKK